MLSFFIKKNLIEICQMGEKTSHIKVKFSNDFLKIINLEILIFYTDSLLLFHIALSLKLSAFSIPLTVFMKTAGRDKTDIHVFWKCVPFFRFAGQYV